MSDKADKVDNAAGQLPREDFEDLPLARTGIPVSLVGQYRVYTDSKNFKLVQADSAAHALEASGVTQVFRIEREAWHKINLIAPHFAAAAMPASPA